MPRVTIPIACCSACQRAYSLEEWRNLEIIRDDPQARAPLAAKVGATLERRKCSTCACVMAFDVRGLEQLDLTMDADRYADLYPDSELPGLARAEAEALVQRSRRQRRQAFALVFALALASVLSMIVYLATRAS